MCVCADKWYHLFVGVVNHETAVAVVIAIRQLGLDAQVGEGCGGPGSGTAVVWFAHFRIGGAGGDAHQPAIALPLAAVTRHIEIPRVRGVKSDETSLPLALLDVDDRQTGRDRERQLAAAHFDLARVARDDPGPTGVANIGERLVLLKHGVPTLV